MRAVRSGCLGSLFVVAVATLAGGPTVAHAQASASEQATGARRAPGRNAVPTSEPLVLEFDVPNDFRTQPAGSADAVTGFRVGYFWPNESAAIRTVDFARDALAVKDRTARVTLPRETVPDCESDCVIRVQTLTREQASGWSSPVRLAPAAGRQAQSSLPGERPRAARPDRTPNAPPARARQHAGLAPGDIEPYASLSESLRKLLQPDASLDAEVQRFRSLEELALAVVISRDYDIPFTTLSRTLEGPPRVPPRSALAKLRRDLDAARIVRRARVDARRMIAAH